MTGARELVVEADGGSRGNPGPAGYGALVRDAATGELLAERAGYLGETTNNVAEYTGLLEGLRAAEAIDARARVHVRMDSRLVVEQMRGTWQIKHDGLRALAVQARAVLPPAQVTYEWIPRAQNGAADALANEAMDSRAPAIVRDFPGTATATTGAQVATVAEARTAAAPPAPTTAGPATAGPSTAGPADAGPATAPAAAARTTAAPTAAGPADIGRARTGEPGETLGVPADAETGAPAPEATWRPAGAFSGLDPREALTLILVRHGVTPMTLAGGLSGGEVPGPPLTPQGRTQAARAADAIFRLGERWHDLPRPTHLVTSPMVRTQEVAAAVGRRLGLTPQVDERLREMEFGEWEALTPAQVEERWPGDFARWFSTGTFAPPGGESYAQVGERVAVAIEDLRDRLAGNAVVAVGHAAMIRTVAGRALDMPPSAWARLRIPPCSLTILRYFPTTTEVVTVGYPT